MEPTSNRLSACELSVVARIGDYWSPLPNGGVGGDTSSTAKSCEELRSVALRSLQLAAADLGEGVELHGVDSTDAQ